MASAAVGLDAFRLRVDDVEFSRALLAQDRESTEIGPVFPVIFSRQSDVAVFTDRSEEHTSELQSLMRISYAVFCLKKKKHKKIKTNSIATANKHNNKQHTTTKE